MTASNQIFLVMDAGTPKAAFTARRELSAYLKRRARHFHQPAGLHVLGQSGHAVDHDDVGGTCRMIEITEMGGAGAWLGVITSAHHAASHHNQGSVAGADTQPRLGD